MTDSDGVTFLRHETVAVTFAVFQLRGGGEHRMSKSRVELRANSMMQHGLPCDETQRALASWPDGKQEIEE